MKISNTKLVFTFLIIPVISLMSCNDQWDEHVKTTVPGLSGTVLEVLKQQPELSLFYEMVVETKYDSLLNSDNTFTVLAPVNSALESNHSGSLEEKESIVRNHIAYLSYNASALVNLDKLTMINGKKIDVSNLSINISNKDILCNNGIVHAVDRTLPPTMNIYEYLSSIEKGEYTQLDLLMEQTKIVMDMEKSIQIGVNDVGKPIYDTVWTYQNHFFDKMAITNEDSLYTFVLLTNNNFNKIIAKYKKYMQQSTEAKTDSVVADELINDLVFRKSEKNVAISGVEIDFSSAEEISRYEASNGVVRIMSGVDVKLENNKVKTIYVEGENLRTTLNSRYLIRLRDWAHGGRDVMVSGTNKQTAQILEDDGTTSKKDYNFNYNTATAAAYTTDANFYLEYGVNIYSMSYDIYWVTYDDMSKHIGAADDPPEATLNLRQKLFISLPGAAKLKRGSTSNGEISNNYLGTNIAFSTEGTLAGVLKEEQLEKYNLTGANSLLDAKVADDPDPYIFF
ncbi:hypothetical protein EZS27_010070 [termite gut metagenome]|uniref:FAS1 domain-containing protein n=1 Tax=termite gut metagenome TaxID=433724 RepID=A0A5J4S915_9ZZZZ